MNVARFTRSRARNAIELMSAQVGIEISNQQRAEREDPSLAKVFFSYSHADEGLRDQLERQLSMLKRQGAIETWHDRRIGAGEEIDRSISKSLDEADIILLLVSPHFLDSDYCYEREMARAIERHKAGEAIVMPVILRACDWHDAPFGGINATPPDGRPINQAPDIDQAFLEVAKAIRAAVKRLHDSGRALAPKTTPPTLATHSQTVMGEAAAIPRVGTLRSSNLRIAKRFTDSDKDAFKLETFEYMARFFEESLNELSARNHEVEGRFRRVDANRFTCVVYVEGKASSRCTIFMSGSRSFVDGIAYIAAETLDSGTLNESVTVDHDEHSLFLRSMGMAFSPDMRGTKLSQEGAAEFFWGMLIDPLQRAR